MPIRDILLDRNGNRVVQGGDYLLADGAQAVEQGIQCRVGLVKGEYWLDESRGVDYFGVVLVRNPVPAIVQGVIGSAIAETPDVTRVGAVSYTPPDPATRRAAVSYNATTTAGPITGSVGVPV